MFSQLGRTMGEHNENFNKEKENTIKYQAEVTKLSNTITEVKNNQRGSIADQMEQENGSLIKKTGQQKAPEQCNKKKNIKK